MTIHYEPWTEDADTVDFDVSSLRRGEARICICDADGFRTISEPIDISKFDIQVQELEL